ncbi:uncharacterized protein LOC133031222 [Cannabis sativa]|uniref:uncharacterized protein LOC133031222 n=1 Tax=Cannabis sativa TaxID=3483 RepID=UPI0029C9B4AE|nr:uncharacterized protein LOC133031222 [Cannabis sativa]
MTQSTLHDCHLHDLELRGYPYTWERGRNTGQLAEIRLDKALATQQWLDIFHEVTLTNLDFSCSDHTPIILDFNNDSHGKIVHHFRFENLWCREPMCKQIVQACWEENTHLSIVEKIKLCGLALDNWGKSLKGNFKKRLAKSKSVMAAMKHDGDKNSKYFHASTSARKRNNQIHQLQDSNGNWVRWDTGLDKVISDYFSNLYSASGAHPSLVVNGIRGIVNSSQNEDLLQQVTSEEVKNALFQMHLDKAPGPDGMGLGFFQKHWDIIGADIVGLVTNFFNTGELPRDLNTTNLVLIPKKKNFLSMNNLRPIALCNVLYKIVSKVLANRMRGIIDKIISTTQSAFIPGRLISDNVMIAFEVMHYLKRKTKGKKGFMALKLDMSKAYDRVEWSYLQEIMSRMGFHDKWIYLLMRCITSVRYNVLHGGNVVGPFTPTRGIRQGDPLSTYLFIICAEGLSMLINSAESNRTIHGCRVARGAPSITHMLFADDSYLFCQASIGAAQGVRNLLSEFEQASGQKVNIAKSSIFFNPNSDAQTRSHISAILGMAEASDGSLYLGLPNIIGRNKSTIFGFLKNKVIARLNSWDGKFLSRAGKEILLKTIIQSLPTYAMSVFLIPLGICEDIEKLMAGFWWKTTSSKGRGITWMSWERMTASKDEGGMGFRCLQEFNLAMLAKQGWRLLCQLKSLIGRVFKAKYFPHTDYLSAKLGNNPSYVWRSIWGAQSVVRTGAIRTIGNGLTTNITSHPWIPHSSNKFVSSSHPALHGHTVASLFAIDERRWDAEIINDLFNHRDATLILGIPLSPNVDTDVWSWTGERSGILSVKSAYNLLQNSKPKRQGADNSGFWRKLWHLKSPPKVKNFLWRATSNCLPTCLQLVSKHVSISSSCPVCKSHPETTVHALLNCQLALHCWSTLGITLNITLSSFGNWLHEAFLKLDEDQVCRAVMLCWALWKARNATVWNKKQSSHTKILASARTTLDHWRKAQDNTCLSSLFFKNKGDGAELWTKPDSNNIKVNVNAALFAQDNSYGFGIVARDSQGKLIEAKTYYHGGDFSAETIEAIGIKEALSWIKNKKWQNVQVETDSMVTVQGIRSNQKMNSTFGLVVQDCQFLLSSLNNVNLFFIRRSANRVAHVIARHSRFFPGCSIFEHNAWADLKALLYSEC